MTRSHVLLLVIMLAAACAGADSGMTPLLQPDGEQWARMLAAEDSRGRAEGGVQPLIEALSSPNPALRQVAVRGLGRLETDSLIPHIAPLLEDSVAAVRAEAAVALGQAARGGDPYAAKSALESRFANEPDTEVRGTIAEMLGRLPHGVGDAENTARLLLATEVSSSTGPASAFRLGAAKGLYYLARQPSLRGALPNLVVTGLRNLQVYGMDSRSIDPAVAARVRRIAAAGLVASAAATESDLVSILRDPDPYVRREAFAGLPALPPERARELAMGALTDSTFTVRYEALRAWARVTPPSEPCPRIHEAVGDANVHVRLLALDLLGRGCGGEAALATLDSVAGSLPATLADTSSGWHAAAHALVALAAVDRVRALARLDAFTGSANPFVRAWAARAAQTAGETAPLYALANDADMNVRTAAVEGLRVLAGRAADSVYIAQLTQNDNQLLLTAARALEGTRHTGALPALLDAFDRFSGARRETWRDARLAMLERIAVLGNRAQAARLEPYLTDYDASVANRVADILGRWTGRRPQPAPAPLPALALPTLAALDSLERARVTIEMADGEITLRLLAFEAPVNAYRFARLAREGYYDGLTIHRIEPNFVVQGGSPAANEYAGDGPYTRDEVGRVSNLRGTVGLSTRGRDTGDAQFYINLIDNIRLDHDYTVFAEVVAGMDVVDGLLEGARIRRITVR